MSTQVVTDQVRFRLAQSMPVVERHRAEILRSIQNRVTSLEAPSEAFGEGDVAVMMLLELLIACAGDIAAFGGTRRLEQTAREHARLGIGGRHYSRFGMSLASAMREALGLRLSPKIVSAWCDTFWVIIRRLAEEGDIPEVDEYLQIIR